MSKSAIIAVILGVSVALGMPLVEKCQDYVILSSRGTFEPQGPSIGFVGMIKTTLSAISGGFEYDVVYPAAPDPTQLTTYIGSEDIEKHIHTGLKVCPQQMYALLGYSQGATVTLEALQNLTGTPAEAAIKAVVFIGNPYQVRNQITTIDQNGGATTRGNNGALLSENPSLGLSQHWEDSGKVRNICYEGDLVCNGIASNTSMANHLLYGSSSSVQKLGADFLISKLG
ncbi:cutinase [Talaromyces proteolyticus]|uniref:Cutinase n=1 Tax=Talaromyces proteolyticus TaxID=1131652 RepID=A0AAD4PWH3_9EURO|nr:cutinase [Talaromyces proteolyticus]KAH8692007.1 cutinase [Talaromyces proteolyticus]